MLFRHFITCFNSTGVVGMGTSEIVAVSGVVPLHRVVLLP